MAEKYKEMGAAADGMKTPADALQEVKLEWEKLRQDSSKLTWVWCLLDGNVYRVIESGGGGIDEAVRTPMTRSDVIWFGGIRVDSPATKFFHVLYVPSGVSPLKRGKAQLQKAAIFNSWPGSSGEASLTEMDEITLRVAIAKLCGCKPDDLV